MLLLRLPLSLFNLTWQSAFLALGQIWANKVRAILTTIGIVIGVASVTTVIAALTGLKANVLKEFASFGASNIVIRPDWSRSMVGRKWTDISIRTRELEGILENCPSVKSYTRLAFMQDSVTYGTKSEPTVQLIGFDPSWHQMMNRNVTLGRPFTLVDNDQGRPVCLVNNKAIEKLGMPLDPTGASLLIGGRRYKVVGVIEPRTDTGMFGGEGSNIEVYLPLLAVDRINFLEGFPLVIAAAQSPDVSEEAVAEVKFFLRRTRHVRIGDPDNFQIESVQQFVDMFRRVSGAITAVAVGIVGISLLVGGVGIMNIMLVSVSERTREIGLRKAVGARPGAILLQFLIEAVMICLMGGLIGLLIGQGMTLVMARIPQAQLQNATIPGWAIALSFGFCAFTGLTFGMFPAIKAARLDPIEALRHE
jgi:putative ABC transport system permease protein